MTGRPAAAGPETHENQQVGHGLLLQISLKCRLVSCAIGNRAQNGKVETLGRNLPGWIRDDQATSARPEVREAKKADG